MLATVDIPVRRLPQILERRIFLILAMPMLIHRTATLVVMLSLSVAYSAERETAPAISRTS